MTTLAPFASTLGSHGIPRRAVIIGLIVGSALTVVNGNYMPVHWPTLILTFLTPIVVVAMSQAAAVRRAITDHHTGRAAPRTFAEAVTGYGIPFRALAIAVTAGLTLATIVGALQVLSGNAVQPAALGIVGQAAVLSFLAGSLSQGIALLRARAWLAA